MKRLVSTLNLTKEDWLRYRKCGITGTDAGAILGLNPYRSEFQVYHDKISDTIENIDNEAMRQGRDLENYYVQLGECLRMLSLYFCRAVRVDCPASLYKETDYDLSCNDRTLRGDHGLRKACAVYQHPHQERYCPGRSVCLRCPA